MSHFSLPALRPGAAHSASLLAALTVAVLLLIPAPAGPPGWLADQLPDALASHLDKVVHAGLFFLLAAFWFRSFERLSGWPRPLLTAVLSAAAYGGLLEILQGLTPARTSSLADAATNLLGALLFAGFTLFRRRRGAG